MARTASHSSSHTKELFASLEQARNSLEVLRSASTGAPEDENLTERIQRRECEERCLEKTLHSLVSRLPSDRWAAAVHGRYICGQSTEVVARGLGVSRSSVYSYLTCAATWGDGHLELWEITP